MKTLWRKWNLFSAGPILVLLLCDTPREVSAWSLFSSSTASLSTPQSKSTATLAPEISSVSNERVVRAQTLLKQLKEGKSHFAPGVRVVSVGTEECGIQYQAPTKKYNPSTVWEDVIFVDRSEFITPELGLETPVGQAFQYFLSQPENLRLVHPEKIPHMYLAIYLVMYKQGLLTEDQASDSAARTTYLDTLPSKAALEHLPLFWNDSMLEELQCSVVKPAVDSRRKEWKQEYLLMQLAIHEMGISDPFGAFSLETWYWARSIICSRAFTDSGNEDHPCLCPYVDMMNHRLQPANGVAEEGVLQCSWSIDGEGYHLQLPTDTAYDPKDPKSPPQLLEISYGSHSSAHFLMNYGFSIIEDDATLQGEEEVATLSLILPDTCQSKEKETLWEADGLGDCHSVARNVTIGIGQPGPMESVLSLCRVASAKRRELLSMKRNFVKKDEHYASKKTGNDKLVPQMGATLCRSPFSRANEIRALKMLQLYTKAALKRYSTTLEQDTNLLTTKQVFGHPASRLLARAGAVVKAMMSAVGSRQVPFTSNLEAEDMQWRNAVHVRREEKKILNHYLNLATIGLMYLQHADQDDDEATFEDYKGMLEASLHDTTLMLAT